MPPARHLAADLHAGWRAKGGQNRLGVGLGVKDIDHPAAAVRVTPGGGTDQKACGLQVLIPRFATLEGGANLEQRQVHEAARLVPRRRRKKAGQKVGAQVRHLGRDRIVHADGITAAAKQGRCLGVDEAVGHTFVVTQACDGAARGAFAHLQGCQDRLWHTGQAAGHRRALQLREAGDAGDFLDQVGVAKDVGPPAGRGHGIAVQGEAKRLKRGALGGFRDVHADKADHAGGVQLVGAGGVDGRAVLHDFGRLAAAKIKDHLRRKLQPRKGEGRVDAAFKAVAGVRVDFQRAPGGGNGDRVPVGAFHENVGGVGRTARRLATHDPGKGFRAVIIADHHLAFGQGIGLAVQRQQRLTLTGGADDKVAGHFGRVEDVQGAVQSKGEVVGDIHQSRDRAQADGLQPRSQPVGRGAVPDAPDHPASEVGTAFGLQSGVDAYGNGRGEAAHNRGCDHWLQRPKPPRGKIARNAVDTQSVGAVRGDLDLDHRVIRAPIVDIPHAKGGVCGQFDDAVVIVRKQQLAFRTQHPVAVDAADVAGLQVNAGAGNMGAGGGENADKAGFRIGRTADDLHFFGPATGAIGIGFHPADAQTVGVGVLHGLDHPADAESAQLCCGVRDPLNLQPKVGQRLGQRIDGGRGVEVIFQPGEGEFHLCVSRCSAAPDLAQRRSHGKRGHDSVAQA